MFTDYHNYDVVLPNVRKGDIYTISLLEKGGAMPSNGLLGKVRPCLVLSDQEVAEKYSLFSNEPNIWILPFTTGENGFTDIEIKTPTGISYPRFDCMQDIRLSRFRQFMYRISEKKMTMIDVEIDKIRGYNPKNIDKKLTEAIDTVVNLKNQISVLMSENDNLKEELKDFSNLKAQIKAKTTSGICDAARKSVAPRATTKQPYVCKTSGIHKEDVVGWDDSKVKEFLEMLDIAKNNKEIMATYDIQSPATLYHISNYCRKRMEVTKN